MNQFHFDFRQKPLQIITFNYIIYNFLYQFNFLGIFFIDFAIKIGCNTSGDVRA